VKTRAKVKLILKLKSKGCHDPCKDGKGGNDPGKDGKGGNE